MQVTLLVDCLGVVNQGQSGGGIMRLTVSSRKEWQKGGHKYILAKMKAELAVYAARKSAKKAKFGNVNSNGQQNRSER